MSKRPTMWSICLLAFCLCACSTDGDSRLDVGHSLDGAAEAATGLDAASQLDTYHYPKGCDIPGKYWFELLQKVSGDCQAGGGYYTQVQIEKQSGGYRISAKADLHQLEANATLAASSCRLQGTGKDLSQSGTEDWDVSADWTFATRKDASGTPIGYGFTGTITLVAACTITYQCQGKWWGK